MQQNQIMTIVKFISSEIIKCSLGDANLNLGLDSSGRPTVSVIQFS